MTNISIKSLVFDQEIPDDCLDNIVSVYLCDVCKAIEKVKENNTLEELTLNRVVITAGYDFDDLCFKIESSVQQINRTRNVKGIANLKVNINCIYDP